MTGSCNECIHNSVCYLQNGCDDFKSKSDYVEVKHGEWIWTESGEEDYEQFWVCSVCKEKSYIETKFCSDCGAKMDGERKDS